MNPQQRCISLWGDYLDGRLDYSSAEELANLLADHPHLRKMVSADFRIHSLLHLLARDNPPGKKRFIQDTMARLPLSQEAFVQSVMARVEPRRQRRPRTISIFWSSALAIAGLILLTGGVLLLQPAGAARIIAMAGPVQWREGTNPVGSRPMTGQALVAGVLESLSAESWVQVGFRDGSSVTISGPSTLAMTGSGLKQLHLERGSFSAQVQPQPPGQPMTVQTPAAMMTVLGTAFIVEAENASTRLDVTEGSVKLRRLADGTVMEVSASQQVVASANDHGKLGTLQRQLPGNSWTAILPKQIIVGIWFPESTRGAGRASTVPLLLPGHREDEIVQACVISASRGPVPPVLLSQGARFRIQGRAPMPGTVFMGVTLRHAGGGLAGKYSTNLELDRMNAAGDFLLELPIANLAANCPGSPKNPVGLELKDWWCGTRNPGSGIEITRVELIPGESVKFQGQPGMPR